ncbi:MAG TPA: CRTAC1 family protein, partial [Prolixibacteraceae bacterium]
MIAFYLRKVRSTLYLPIAAILSLLTILSQSTTAQEFSRIESSAGFNLKESTKGIAVADYDGDHDLDIFVVVQQTYDSLNVKTWNKLFRNNNDATFTDVTKAANLDKSISSLYTKRGASWGDYNNDGWPDLLLAYQSGVQLYQNLGDGKFKDVTQSANLNVSIGCEVKSSMWWDYNNDGLLDLFISGFSGCNENKVYKNLGNGTFENVTTSLGLNISNLSYMSIPIDVNHDGFTDVYSSVDFGENQLFVSNSGNSFTEKAAEYHLNSPGNNMGLATGDYNNDGIFDIYCTDIKANSLFKGNKNNIFSDLAATYGIQNTDWAWQSRFADFDNDGDEDIYVVNGYGGVAYQNVLFKNLMVEKGGGFSDNSESSNLGISALNECFETFDYDNDGDMDILISSELGGESPAFFNNKTIDQIVTPGKRWLKVSLEGNKSNRNGFGASLEIRYGGKKQFRLYHGVGLYSQSVQPIHFGVGTTSQIDTLLVNWPSGEIDTLIALP